MPEPMPAREASSSRRPIVHSDTDRHFATASGGHGANLGHRPLRGPGYWRAEISRNGIRRFDPVIGELCAARLQLAYYHRQEPSLSAHCALVGKKFAPSGYCIGDQIPTNARCSLRCAYIHVIDRASWRRHREP